LIKTEKYIFTQHYTVLFIKQLLILSFG